MQVDKLPLALIQFTFTGICFVVVSISAHADPHQVINFEQAVSFALESNPRMNASAALIDAARGGVDEKRGKLFPRINLEIDSARSDNPLNVFSYKLSQGNVKFSDYGLSPLIGPSSPSNALKHLNSPGYYDNVNTGVVLNVPIFTGGYNRASLEKSRHLLTQAQHGNEAARNELIYDVLQAYEGTRVSKELVKIAKQSLRQADAYLKTTQALREQSLVTESDVFIAQANQRAAVMTLKSTEAELNNQLDTFRLLIGKASSDLVPGAPATIRLPSESLDEIKHRAVVNNPELLSLKAQVNANQAQIAAANAAYWPQIGLQVRQDWNDQTLSLSSPSNTLFLGFDWELFSIGTRSGISKQARAEYKQAAAELDNNAINIQIAVAQALRAAKTAEEQLNTSTLNKESTNAAVKLLKDRYGRGAAPLPMLLDSQSRLDTFKAQQVMAEYDRSLSRAKVLKILNEFDWIAKNDRAE